MADVLDIEARISEDKPIQHLKGLWHSLSGTLGKSGQDSPRLILPKHVVYTGTETARRSWTAMFTAHSELMKLLVGLGFLSCPETLHPS